MRRTQLPAATRNPGELAGEVVGKTQQERFRRADAVTGEGVHGVLLGVGCHHMAVVAFEVGCLEITAGCEVTFRSSIWWRSVSRVTLTTRTSALPYWFSPRTMLLLMVISQLL